MIEKTVASLVEPLIEKMGYDVVRIQISWSEKRCTLQIMAERKDQKSMTVDDCAAISRMLSPVLDEKDPIASEYTLEVSSPGIDRPLVRKEDFERFKGFNAKIELNAPVDGRKRFKGRLLGVENADILLDFEGKKVNLPFSEIAKAKLVLDDELIKAFS